MASMLSAVAERSVPDAGEPVYASRIKLIFPHITIDGHSCLAEVDGVPLHLTSYEFEILYLLACFSDKIMSAREIYRRIWQMEDLGRLAPVLMHISNLRKKLRTACPGRVFIGTQWKKGYQFIAGDR